MFALADGHLGTGAGHDGEVLDRRGQGLAAGRPEIIEPTAVLGFMTSMLTPYHQRWQTSRYPAGLPGLSVFKDRPGRRHRC